MNNELAIQERNLIIYAFIVPIVSVAVWIIAYAAIFATRLTAMSYYSMGGGALLGLGGGTIALAVILGLVQIAAVVYFVIIWNGVARDINTMCAGDAQSTPLMVFVGAYLIGALVPFGFIYYLYYLYKMQDKLYRNAYRYNANVTWSPVAVLLFAIFINIVAFILIVISFNEMARAYNASKGLESENPYGSESADIGDQLMEPLRDMGIGVGKQGLLRCTAGETAGASIIMNNGDTVILGRDPQAANVVLRQDKKVSRRHCAVTFRNGQFYVTDFSSNGTKLANGQRLESNVETLLGGQGEIHLSEQTTFTVKNKPN